MATLTATAIAFIFLVESTSKAEPINIGTIIVTGFWKYFNLLVEMVNAPLNQCKDAFENVALGTLISDRKSRYLPLGQHGFCYFESRFAVLIASIRMLRTRGRCRLN